MFFVRVTKICCVFVWTLDFGKPLRKSLRVKSFDFVGQTTRQFAAEEVFYYDSLVLTSHTNNVANAVSQVLINISTYSADFYLVGP